MAVPQPRMRGDCLAVGRFVQFSTHITCTPVDPPRETTTMMLVRIAVIVPALVLEVKLYLSYMS